MTDDMKESMGKEGPRRRGKESNRRTLTGMMTGEQMYRVVSLQGGTQAVKSIV